MKIKIVLILFLTIILLGVSVIPVSTSDDSNCPTCVGTSAVVIDGRYPVMTDMGPKPGSDVMRYDSGSDLPRATNLPGYFSWRDHLGEDWTTPARNQGSCGSCWAFAAVATIEAQLNIVSNDPNLDLDLSEQYILSCFPGSGSCTGGWTQAALSEIIEHGGVITEDCFPYTADDTTPCSNKCSNWQDDLYQISDYHTYTCTNPESTESIDALKECLVESGPLAVYIYSTSDFALFWSGHHDPDSYYPYTGVYDTFNHVVLLVGWKDVLNSTNGGYWILKNSWGSYWGYNGFFNLEYGALAVGREAVSVEVNSSEVDFEFTTENDTVSFSYIGPPAVSYWWNFGDHYFSDLPNPIHCYYNLGTYNVTLIVTFSNGSVGSVSKEISLLPIQLVANFTYTPSNPTINTIIQFTDTSYDPSEVITNWTWSFGDGGVSFLQNPQHQYTTAGLYTVNLTVGDNMYVSDTCTRYVNVVVSQTEQLDQIQTQGNYYTKIYGSNQGAQSFKPSLDTLTKVELYVNKVGSPSADLVVSIRSSLSGQDLTAISKSPSQIPSSPGWVEFDFNDISVTPDSTYYIVVKAGGSSSSNRYNWWYSTTNTYSRGEYWVNSGSSWSVNAGRDFCFKTYGLT